MRDSGDRPSREPESATFEASRVATRRAKPPVFIVGFVAVIVGLIAISFASRGSATAGASTAAPASAAVVPIPSLQPTATTTTLQNPIPTPRIFIPDQGPVVTSAPGLIELVARRQTGAMFVHGDVFVPHVTWVYVSLLDDAGNVAGWASVSVPGAAGPGHGEGPTLRFDVELPVPETFETRLWLNANAYDADSTLIATVRLQVPTITRPRIEFEP